MKDILLLKMGYDEVLRVFECLDATVLWYRPSKANYLANKTQDNHYNCDA